MDPTQAMDFLREWSLVIVTVFTGLVTAASFALRMIASYIKYVQEYLPEYKPSRSLISFMAVLSALSQNSATAATIVSNGKGK